MEGERLGEKYAYVFKDLAAFARAENKIDETNIYQEANPKILPILDKMLEENLLPGSRMEGLENIKVFAKVLEDAGVYKNTDEGKAAFLRFIDELNKEAI